MPEPNVNLIKTYTPLTDIPKAIIGKCSAVLPNHMACWRSGDFQVTIPGEVVTDEETGKVTQEITQYQLCRRHAQAELENDVVLAAAKQAVANDEAQLAAAEVAQQKIDSNINTASTN
jgi:hypothetical protein